MLYYVNHGTNLPILSKVRMNGNNYILVADSHLREDAAEDFFAMLAAIRQYEPAGVIFLGDIFELWIAFDGYESSIHTRFLDWCREAKAHFEVGFILGNHEFYVMEPHGEAFTWITERSRLTSGLLCLHGDLINRADKRYLLLRKVLRSRLIRFLLRITARTIGPAVSDRVRRSLKTTNRRFKRELPAAELENFARAVSSDQVRRIYVGHFHQHAVLDFPDAAPMEILPSWEVGGEIVCMTPEGESLCAPWRELLKTDR